MLGAFVVLTGIAKLILWLLPSYSSWKIKLLYNPTTSSRTGFTASRMAVASWYSAVCSSMNLSWELSIIPGVHQPMGHGCELSDCIVCSCSYRFVSFCGFVGVLHRLEYFMSMMWLAHLCHLSLDISAAFPLQNGFFKMAVNGYNMWFLIGAALGAQVHGLERFYHPAREPFQPFHSPRWPFLMSLSLNPLHILWVCKGVCLAYSGFI